MTKALGWDIVKVGMNAVTDSKIISIGLAKIVKDCDVSSGRVVAIATTRNGHVIAAETNRQTSGVHNEWSIHAERFLAIKLNRINTKNRFRHITVYVMRLADYGITMARPCEHCQEALRNCGYIEEIYYSNWDGEFIRFKDGIIDEKPSSIPTNKGLLKKVFNASNAKKLSRNSSK